MIHHETDEWFYRRCEFGYQIGVVVGDIEHQLESLDERHIHHRRSIGFSTARFGGERFRVASYCLVDSVRKMVVFNEFLKVNFGVVSQEEQDPGT